MNYYLMKSEGSCYSIADLKKDKKTAWTGVRNYQARNYMKAMKKGDMILFYHSSSKPTGVFGLAKVVKKAHADMSAQDRKHEHFDPKATKEKPIWECVDVAYVATFTKPVTLDDMKKVDVLGKMKMFTKGSRLSITPVTKIEYDSICKMGSTK